VVSVSARVDDGVSHDLGWWTPLDAGWGQLYHLIPWPASENHRLFDMAISRNSR
jgi:hypothetical protein